METNQARTSTRMKPDYITATLDADAKWVTDSFVKGRRIAFYGIGVAVSCLGDKITINPVIPCVGPLAKLVKRHPKDCMFKFDRKMRKWVVMR